MTIVISSISAVLILILLLIARYLQLAKARLISEIKEKNIEERKLQDSLKKYQGIISIEEEIVSQKTEFEKIQEDAISLNEKYVKAKSTFSELEKEIHLYQNDLEFVEFGMYEPIFDLDTSEIYKERITHNIQKQKDLVKIGNACKCDIIWQVDNSKKKGEMMTKRNISLSLRAFNGECDSLIAKVKWNNITRFEERMARVFKAINKLGISNKIYITEEYLKSKVDQLHLTYELEFKKQEEKETQRQIRADLREEERSQREFEKAEKEAQIEERRFQKALEKAQKELGFVSGDELEKLNSQIENLKQSLAKAHQDKERAISRAQETKSGHVYIISNVGSFGDNIYKIGMTRRMEPLDRVKELGDASVPFLFDLHAMIYSENAPELESLLHKEFHDRRINKINKRKEYFNVTLSEIQKVIQEKFNKEVDFVEIAEAQEFRETQIILKSIEEASTSTQNQTNEKYPECLF